MLMRRCHGDDDVNDDDDDDDDDDVEMRMVREK